MTFSTDEFTAEFETFRSQLASFILRMTASVQDTEDIVQDTYLTAQEKIDTFRGESSLKTWVFAIAANQARDLLRARKRWPENVTDICREAALKNRPFFQRPCRHQQINLQSGNGRQRPHRRPAGDRLVAADQRGRFRPLELHRRFRRRGDSAGGND